VRDLPPPPPPANAPPNRWRWLLALIPLGVGAFLGYQASYQSSLGGLGGALGSAYIAIAIGALVVVVAAVGVANLLRRAGRGRTASRYAFAASGLILAGGAGGAAAVPAFDLGYHPPVTLSARGEASIMLEGVPTFEARSSGRADCWSIADGIAVQEIVALSLGELNGSVLRADIFLPLQEMPQGSISLFIEASRLPEGSVPPMWNTQDVVIESSSGGTTGHLRFQEVPIREDEDMGLPPGTWPATLTGEVTWRCDPWLAADATPPPATAAQITLNLSEVDWSATAGSVGSCEFEADGSVANITGGPVGSLQGKPMALALGLVGDPRPGDDVDLMLTVQIEPPAPGGSLPLAALVAATSGRTIGWQELVTIEEIADGGRSGRLTFTELPIAGTADPAWPATLSGQLNWECS
jgi:hypothetical protein